MIDQPNRPLHLPPVPETSEIEWPNPPQPIEVDQAVFLAARLRETLAEAANLRHTVAELQAENARLRANAAQTEINQLEADYNVGSGTVLQKRPDGTYWRLPVQSRQG